MIIGRDVKAHQLYDLPTDPCELKNVAKQYPELVQQFTTALEKARSDGRTRP